MKKFWGTVGLGIFFAIIILIRCEFPFLNFTRIELAAYGGPLLFVAGLIIAVIWGLFKLFSGIVKSIAGFFKNRKMVQIARESDAGFPPKRTAQFTADESFNQAKPLYEKEWYKEAYPYMKKAAGQGHTMAQYHLGEMFEYGLGVEKDEKEAAAWFKKAAEQGDTFAGQCLERLNRKRGAGSQ